MYNEVKIAKVKSPSCYASEALVRPSYTHGHVIFIFKKNKRRWEKLMWILGSRSFLIHFMCHSLVFQMQMLFLSLGEEKW